MLIFFCTNRKIDWYLKSHFFLNQYIFTSLFFCGINVVSKDCTSKIEFIVSSSSNFPYDYVVKDTQTWRLRVAADDNNSHRLRNYFVDSKKKTKAKAKISIAYPEGTFFPEAEVKIAIPCCGTCWKNGISCNFSCRQMIKAWKYLFARFKSKDFNSQNASVWLARC